MVKKNPLFGKSNWYPPSHWQKITTLDLHTAGEPLRVILDGYPELEGETILDRRRYARNKVDSLRTALMWEPRGHADMYGCIVTSPVTPDADFGVLFLHNEGYSTMCGHGIIAVTKAMLELGYLPATEPVSEVKIDTPAGLVTAYGRISQQTVESVYFHNVPSFVVELEASVIVPDMGEIRYDLAFGGAYYAFVNATGLGLELIPENFRRLIETGMAIKKAIMQSREIIHPSDEDLGFLYGTIFIGPSQSPEADNRNVCIFADGEVDRSPTGTGVSARMAIHFARGDIGLNQKMVIESLIGSRFSGKVIGTTTFGPFAAVIPEVEGSASIVAKNEFYIDPDDPLKNGFLLR